MVLSRPYQVLMCSSYAVLATTLIKLSYRYESLVWLFSHYCHLSLVTHHSWMYVIMYWYLVAVDQTVVGSNTVVGSDEV